jgi:hypothetical protein
MMHSESFHSGFSRFSRSVQTANDNDKMVGNADKVNPIVESNGDRKANRKKLNERHRTEQDKVYQYLFCAYKMRAEYKRMCE